MQNLPSELMEQLHDPRAQHRLGRILDSLVGATTEGTAERVRLAPVPASASAPGVPGQMAADKDYLYICVAVNTWRQVAVSSF